ncbi:7351_t:CDS:2, partial [Dentiscutata heterogama]
MLNSEAFLTVIFLHNGLLIKKDCGPFVPATVYQLIFHVPQFFLRSMSFKPVELRVLIKTLEKSMTWHHGKEYDKRSG